MDLGWAAVIQAVLIALSTAYVRSKAKEDARSVTMKTVSNETGYEILERVKALETDLALVKQLALRNNTIDHRGPRPTTQKG